MRFPKFTRTVAAAQIDRNHHAEQSPLNTVAMQFEVAPDGRRHQRENDVIHAGPAGVCRMALTSASGISAQANFCGPR